MALSVFAVDDSRTMRDMIKHALTQAGFDVELATDGAEGLTMLEGLAPDVIITDINMPNLDGFGFIEGVRQSDEHRGTPILVLTTESAPELKQRAKASGATGWIVKPFDPEQLAGVVRRVAI